MEEKEKGIMLPESYCPSCNKLLNAAEEIEGDATPKSGDYSLCFYCGTILIFTEDLTLELIDDHSTIPPPHRIVLEQEAKNIRKFWETEKRKIT